MELDLRTWKPQSADGRLLVVTKETQQETAGILSEIFEQDEQTSNQHLDFLLSRPDGQVFLYQNEGVLVGTVNVHYLSKTVAMIHALGVHPSYRRMGHGRAMLTELLTLLAKTVFSARLEVDSDNPPALALYRSMGFCTLNRVDYHAMIF